jgi:hypothetical protein
VDSEEGREGDKDLLMDTRGVGLMYSTLIVIILRLRTIMSSFN